MSKQNNLYYHAGIWLESSKSIRWSEETKEEAVDAESEAISMAKEFGGTPVVEYWHRKEGLYPGDADVVKGVYLVEEGVNS